MLPNVYPTPCFAHAANTHAPTPMRHAQSIYRTNADTKTKNPPQRMRGPLGSPIRPPC